MRLSNPLLEVGKGKGRQAGRQTGQVGFETDGQVDKIDRIEHFF